MISTRIAGAALLTATLVRPVSNRLHGKLARLSDRFLGPAVERLTSRA